MQDKSLRKPLVSVIIPTWNGRDHLERCLPSVVGQGYEPVEIIVVDNGSTDGTVGWLAREWGEVRVLALPRNVGFASGVNAGLSIARGGLIALLNNDTEAEPDWLARLVEAACRHPDAGMVASKLKLWTDRSRLHSAGDFYTVSGRPGNRGVWSEDDGRWEEEEWIFAPCAGAALYRRELFDTVGTFDERFGSYLEDVDLAWRAQLAGFRCRFAPQAIVYHKVSATGGGPLASYYNGRNWIYVLVKNVPLSILRRYWRAILWEQARVAWEALRAWRGAAARARLRGQLAGLLAVPKLLRWRRGNLAGRSPQVSDTEILALLERPFAES
ncbi:MAG: glycosyltransferase family 2 protein [Chloroflexota bacterium]|nr:glycosyltransferase family 2 protein [Chloroflexota bacterium]